MSCPLTTALGAYVLGALDRDERAGLEAHLEGCPPCRAELDRLVALPGLLSRLTADEATAIAAPGAAKAGPEPPPELLDGVLAAVGRERRRARLRSRIAAAAAIVVAAAALAAGATTLLRSGDEDGAPPRSSFVASAWNESSDVRASVRLTGQPGGTRLALSLAGVRPGQRCWLVARTAGGRREVVARWRATYAGAARLPGYVHVEVERLVALDVETPSGRRLLRIPIARP